MNPIRRKHVEQPLSLAPSSDFLVSMMTAKTPKKSTRAERKREIATAARAWRKKLRAARKPDGRACDWAVAAATNIVANEAAKLVPLDAKAIMLRAVRLLVAKKYDRKETFKALIKRAEYHARISAGWDRDPVDYDAKALLGKLT